MKNCTTSVSVGKGLLLLGYLLPFISKRLLLYALNSGEKFGRRKSFIVLWPIQII